MFKDIIIGTAVIVVAFGFMIYIVLWSRKTIEYIKRKKLGSAREITKEMNERR